MDYILGSTLTFKYIFHYDFIVDIIIGTQYMIHDEKKKWIENNSNMQSTRNHSLFD